MPKFPGLSGKEIVRALERLGFRVTRQSGSHILVKRGEKGCVAPNHKEVKVGTVNGILRQAEISPEVFQKALSDLPSRFSRHIYVTFGSLGDISPVVSA